MDEYKGCLCKLCGKEFDGDDDIVVCPDCGTPMHRACWNESRACPYTDKHAAGYVWKNEKKSAPKEATDAQADGDSDELSEDMTINEMIEKVILQREKAEGEPVECDGVTQKELLYFFGRSNVFTPRYIAYCAQLAVTGKKTSLNLFAAVFSAPYYFYRRMNLPAVILSLALALLSLPQLLIYVGYYVPDMQEAIDKIARSSMYSTLSTTFLFIQGLILVAILIFGDFVYVRWSLRKIRSIRVRYGDDRGEDYLLALEAAGAPRLSGFFLGVVLTGCINTAMLWLMYIAISGITPA